MIKLIPYHLKFLIFIFTLTIVINNASGNNETFDDDLL